MYAIGMSGRHIFWMGQLQIPLACYRKGHCTPEGIPLNPDPEWWGTSPNNPPELNQRIERNSKAIWEELSKFPYPAPFLPGEAVSFFLSKLKPDLGWLAASLDDLGSDAIRLWITLEVLANYNDWTQMIEQALKKLAERRKKIALVRTIVVAIGSIVVGFAAPVAIAAIYSVVQTATKYYIDAKKAKEAAKSLKEAEAAFIKSDPEFSKEVSRAQEAMDNYAKRMEASATEPGTLPSTPIATSTGGPPTSGPSTALLVGGGVVAAGIAALAIFR